MPDNEISASVGRWSKGAVNNEADVRTIQSMLTEVATILADSRYDPQGVDGTINQDEQDSDTVKAIEAFQRRFVTTPDGLIEVGKRTWQELVAALAGPVTEPGEFFFPLKQLPAENWTGGIRRFGANRTSSSGSRRAHAGCDLYSPPGTVIHAITAGRVVRGPYEFYQGTFALEIDHGTFIARYGEIERTTLVNEGDQVTAGQPVAKIGDLTDITASMLHLELYDKSATGDLNVLGAGGAVRADNVPFRRRRDLIDPTAKLNVWKNNLPT
ncbi:MAG TPA: peptidoglycan DD-metalloendopeptidase family protein [Pyrinomonadaceae bacterium]|nr:peptidoglycan DD-metalloendopeptidase family protein [Pyrinomonadaceae bacterium]